MRVGSSLLCSTALWLRAWLLMLEPLHVVRHVTWCMQYEVAAVVESNCACEDVYAEAIFVQGVGRSQCRPDFWVA